MNTTHTTEDTTMTTTTRTITVTTTHYDGADFPEAASYDQYLADELARIYPGADVTVEFGRNERVSVNGYENDHEIEKDVTDELPNLWEAFCAHGYKAFATPVPTYSAMSKMTLSAVDAAIDASDDADDIAAALRDLLDRNGAWGEYLGTERFALVESSGAWWAVRASEHDVEACRRADEDEARELLARWL